MAIFGDTLGDLTRNDMADRAQREAAAQGWANVLLQSRQLDNQRYVHDRPSGNVLATTGAQERMWAAPSGNARLQSDLERFKWGNMSAGDAARNEILKQELQQRALQQEAANEIARAQLEQQNNLNRANIANSERQWTGMTPYQRESLDINRLGVLTGMYPYMAPSTDQQLMYNELVKQAQERADQANKEYITRFEGYGKPASDWFGFGKGPAEALDEVKRMFGDSMIEFKPGENDRAPGRFVPRQMTPPSGATASDRNALISAILERAGFKPVEPGGLPAGVRPRVFDARTGGFMPATSSY